MTVDVTEKAAKTEVEISLESTLKQPAQELLLYRLQCGRTANGLSHYYMYGDLEPERTVL